MLKRNNRNINFKYYNNPIRKKFINKTIVFYFAIQG